MFIKIKQNSLDNFMLFDRKYTLKLFIIFLKKLPGVSCSYKKLASLIKITVLSYKLLTL